MRAPHRLGAIAIGLSAALLLPGPAEGVQPAADGTRLFEALERVPVAVVARVESRRRLDDTGFLGVLVVEESLVGDRARGAPLEIAWEELSPAREPRFATSDRVLLCLEPLTPTSLWRQRLPEPGALRRVLAVAQRGDAFLRDPSPGGVQIVRHYLALGPDLFEGPTGARHLAALAAEAEPPLALSALRRLDAMANLARALEAPSGELLVRALLREESPPLRPELLELIRRHRPGALRPPLEKRLAATASPPPALFVAAGLLDGGLGTQRVDWLLEQAPLDYRVAAARFAGPADASRVGRLARADHAPEVRAAAVERVVALRGAEALELALGAFSDSDRNVRLAAARSVASLGETALPRLRDIADDWPSPAPQTAVVALSLLRSDEALAALAELAEAHPDEGVRLLARLALGQPVGHTHD